MDVAGQRPSATILREVAEEVYIRGGLDAMRLYAYWRNGTNTSATASRPLPRPRAIG